MIKLRIQGEPLEVEKYIEHICNEDNALRVLQISKNYANRGASIYVRSYVDVELIDGNQTSDQKLIEGGRR